MMPPIVREPMEFQGFSAVDIDESRIVDPPPKLIITPKAKLKRRSVKRSAPQESPPAEARPATDGREQLAQAQQQLAQRMSRVELVATTPPLNVEVEEEAPKQTYGSLVDDLLAANDHREETTVVASQTKKQRTQKR
jgi:hypothetical protein